MAETDIPAPTPGAQSANWERQLLERLALEHLKEKRRARRWGMVFKFLILLYLVAVFIAYQAGKVTPITGKHTALVEIDGVIGPGNEVTADTVISGLRSAFEEKNARGLILRMNSPGGSPVQSGYINDEIMRLRGDRPDLPVYAVISDICASGCYYAAAAAEKIYADKASIVGSIGVLMDNFGFVDAIKKLGIERRLLVAGEHKGILDPFSPMSPQARGHAQDMLDQIHEQFISRVQEGRGDRLSDEPDIFSGLFWTGEQAKELGLVDELGSSSFVAREIFEAEEIIDYTPKRDILDRFVDRFGMALAKALQLNFGTQASPLR